MPSAGTRPVVSTRRSSRVSLPKPDVAHPDWPCLLRIDWTKEKSSTRSTVANGWGRASVGEPTGGAHSQSQERDDKGVDIVYRRKRQRQHKAECSSSSKSHDNNGDNKRFGIVFTRQKRNKRPKLASLGEIMGKGNNEVKVFENGVKEERRVARLVLVVLVESRENISGIFLEFLLSVLGWMRRNKGARIRRLINLLLNGPIARVFSDHGVQFLSAREGKDGVVPGDYYLPPHFGLCKLYSPNDSIPILSLNFSSLPFYFISLHLQFSISSLYISPFLTNPASPSLQNDDDDDDGFYYYETKPSPPKVIKIKPILRIKTRSINPTNFPDKNPKPSSPLSEPSRTLRSSSSLKRHNQKKPTSTPTNRTNNSFSRATSAKPSFCLNSHRPKPLELPPDDSSQSGMDSDVSTTPLGRHWKSGSGSGPGSASLKSPVMRIHERLALAEAKQNIDSVRLKINILVTLEDRCYREDHVVLSMEHSSDSDDWLICVTLQDNSKFSHKPSEMRACVVNRFTHAYMWTVDDVMRLEFVEKMDWLLFKELHAECRLRNSQVRVKVKEVGPVQIPIPGVVEVKGYEAETRLDRPFVLPELYIRVLGDEVERLIKKECPIYEADSGDERWIDGFNNNEESDSRVRVSLEEFEGLVSLFEKDAYVNNINNESNEGKKSEFVGEIDGVVERCKELEKGDADVVAAVYEYWLKKRGTKGGAPLIRSFQGVRVRRVEWCQKPYLKKKRSFKRQRSQLTRLKSEPFIHDWAEEEANRRAHEAELAAKRAVELAIQMRTRAQTLMEQADLATYRSFMAFRIADAKSRLSHQDDHHQSDLDLDPYPLL